MTTNKIIYYERFHMDDIGKKINDMFSKDMPEFIGYNKLWSGVIDGFKECKNSDLVFTCTEGNIRIVICEPNLENNTNSFTQFFLSEMDGKVLKLMKNTKFAIQNIDEGKSSYMIGYNSESLAYMYSSKSIFDWRRKLA